MGLILLLTAHSYTCLVTALTQCNVLTITMSADGAYVYAHQSTTDTIVSYSRDSITGALAYINTVSIVDCYAIVISPDGAFGYATSFTNNQLKTYSILSGVLTEIASIAITQAAGIAITSDGKALYVSSYANNDIYQFMRDTVTGALTALSPATVADAGSPFYMGILPSSSYVYTSNIGNNTIAMFKKN